MKKLLELKNDKQRLAFLDDYTNEENGWYLWESWFSMTRRFWRYDLPDCSIIVEEDDWTLTWPEKTVKKRIENWFIIRDWTFKTATFRDQQASRTLALAEIKRVQKEARA